MNVVTIRASSLSNLFDCPARWAAKNIDKIHIPSSSKARLGTAIHASTAVYDQSTLDGAGITIDEAAAAAVDAIHNPNEAVNWEDEDPAKLEKVAVALHKLYCTEIAPKQEYIAVEVRCDSLLFTDLRIQLTGTTDRIRVTPEGNGIVDIKSGGNAVKADKTVSTQGHTYQMGVYELMAEFASGLPITAPAQIAGLQTGKTEKGQRAGTGEIVGAREALIGTEEMPGILETAAAMVHAGNFYGNPKSMLCHETYCPIFNKCFYRK